MSDRTRIGAFLFLILFLFSGCAPVISKGVRDQVDEELTFREVNRDPEAHRGKMVVWGGVIIGAENRKEGTLIEILQKPMDFLGQPQDTDRTGGRFLALYKGFLDAEIYAKGRELTVGGEITGKRTLPLGEIQYTYPLLEAREIHLWPEAPKQDRYPPPYWYYPPYYDPWWWHFHYWGPYRHYW